MDPNFNMYKKDTYLFFHKKSIDEIFDKIINFLNFENIDIINIDLFYSQISNYIYKNSFNTIKSKNNYSINNLDDDFQSSLSSTIP
jgi:hypothetical protein